MHPNGREFLIIKTGNLFNGEIIMDQGKQGVSLKNIPLKNNFTRNGNIYKKLFYYWVF